MTETATGGELTIDHFQPVSWGGDDSDNNLVYTCFRCNTYKGDFFPNPIDREQGRRLLHPLLDQIPLHIQENEQTGRLEPLTETGRFHIFLLRLNRPQLIEQRLTQRMQELLIQTHQLLRDENEELRLRVVLLELYLRELTRRHAEETEGEGGEPGSKPNN